MPPAGRGRMGRIQQLPSTLKARLDELLRSGVPQRAILDQLAPLLDEAGERPVSRSSLNRYAARMEAMGRRIREAREVAAAWTARFGETPTGDVGAHALEMLRTLVFDLTIKAEDGELDPEQLNHLALALARIERAASASAARERALRKELAEQAAKEAERAAREASAAAGHQLAPEHLRAIREQVYGIVDAAA